MSAEDEICASCGYTWYSHTVIGSQAQGCSFVASGRAHPVLELFDGEARERVAESLREEPIEIGSFSLDKSGDS